MSLIDRRGLLLAGGTAGVTLAIGAGAYGAAAKDPFTLGVASGDPAPDGFVIWTRLAPEPHAEDGSGGLSGRVPVSWEVAADEAMKHVVRRGTALADGALAHSVHVEVAGLLPARPYWYRFAAQGHRSRIGRARTAPAPGAPNARLNCGFVSCSHYEVGWFSAYRHLAEEQPDFVAFLGDYMYEYSYTGDRADHAVRRHEQTSEVKTLAQYRNRYATHRLDEDLALLHAAAPAVTTWDDHEVQNDYANRWSADPKIPVDEFLKRRAAAYQAYYEHMPVRRAQIPKGPDARIYRRLPFGALADVTVLDGRQYRSEQPCATPTWRGGHLAECAERIDPARTMLGAEQERWLYSGFRTGKAKWNIVAQDLLIAPLETRDPKGQVAFNTDGWDGYPATRERMLSALAEAGTRNVVFFGGDIHSSWVTDLKRNFDHPDSATLATEFVGTSITSDNSSRLQGDLSPLYRTGFIKWVDARTHGYMTAEVTPQRLTTRYRIVSDRKLKDATISTQKTWVVEDGKAGAVEA